MFSKSFLKFRANDLKTTSRFISINKIYKIQRGLRIESGFVALGERISRGLENKRRGSILEGKRERFRRRFLVRVFRREKSKVIGGSRFGFSVETLGRKKTKVLGGGSTVLFSAFSFQLTGINRRCFTSSLNYPQ